MRAETEAERLEQRFHVTCYFPSKGTRRNAGGTGRARSTFVYCRDITGPSRKRANFMRRTRNVGDWITEAAKAYAQMNERDLSGPRRRQLCADYGHQPTYPSGKGNFCTRCGAEVNTVDFAVAFSVSPWT